MTIIHRWYEYFIVLKVLTCALISQLSDWRGSSTPFELQLSVSISPTDAESDVPFIQLCKMDHHLVADPEGFEPFSLPAGQTQ